MTPCTLQNEAKLRIGELANRTGVTRATVHHYVRVGLLPDPVRPNPRMAYYDPACVERIRMIRELREQRMMSLAAIKQLLDRADELGLTEVDEQILRPYRERRWFGRDELLGAYPVGDEVFDELVATGALCEADGRFSEDDVEVLRCVHEMRQAGLDGTNGFEPDMIATYVSAVEQLIDREFAVFNERVLGTAPAADAARLARVSIHFVSRMLAAMHRRRLMRRLGAIGAEEMSP